VDHRFMILWTHSTRKLCLEPTPYLRRILAIGVAEFPGEIRLFTPDFDTNRYIFPDG
jgi:hypothetical protein